MTDISAPDPDASELLSATALSGARTALEALRKKAAETPANLAHEGETLISLVVPLANGLLSKNAQDAISSMRTNLVKKLRALQEEESHSENVTHALRALSKIEDLIDSLEKLHEMREGNLPETQPQSVWKRLTQSNIAVLTKHYAGSARDVVRDVWRNDIPTFVANRTAPHTWGNSVLNRGIQLQSNQLQYGQIGEPSEADARESLRTEHIDSTLQSLPAGDRNADALRQAMTSFNSCVAGVRSFSSSVTEANAIERSEDQVVELSRTFDEMVTAIEAMLAQYKQYIEPNESVINSPTERTVVAERLEWLEQVLQSLKSTSGKIGSMPILPLVFKSHAHRAGNAKGIHLRQDTMRQLSQNVSAMRTNVEKPAASTTAARKMKEWLSPVGRIWEQAVVTQNALIKLIAAGTILYGGANWYFSGEEEPDDLPNQPTTTQPAQTNPSAAQPAQPKPATRQN